MAIAAVLVTFAVSFIIFIFCVRTYSILSQKNYTRKDSLVGKVALVTGGSSGIGYQIVLGLASRGCKVIVADLVVHESIKQEIYKHTRNPNVSIKYLDLSSFSSVRAFAEDIKNSEDKLDILINNAGVAREHSLRTEDGIAVTMQVNCYSAFLLTHLLLDMIPPYINWANNDPYTIYEDRGGSEIRCRNYLQSYIGHGINHVKSNFVSRTASYIQMGVKLNSLRAYMIHEIIKQRKDPCT